jgi:alanine racemase
MDNTSFIEISETAFRNNVDYINSRLNPGTILSHVVKGNAYGHGIEEYVPMAQRNGAKHFSVFDAHEAFRVKKVAPHVDIMIMGMISESQLEWAIESEVSFYIFEVNRLVKAIEKAKKIGKKALIHLEIETGMNRSGLEELSWETVFRLINSEKDFLEVMGFCTHYAGAETIGNHPRVLEQMQRFDAAKKSFKAAGIVAKKNHSACSAAFLRFPQSQQDLVRIGILQYGFWPSAETYLAVEHSLSQKPDPLHRLLSWKSTVMNVKEVKKGEYIGYGSSYMAAYDMQIAAVPVGYSHGFSRSLSNSGRALIHGERVGVVGVVNMNVMMLDITHIESVQAGDEVVLIGTQGDLSISVSSFSEYSDQMNYELLTRLPLDIPRIIRS